MRRASDYARRVGAVFSLAPGEKIFGTGESFTRLDKRGQRVVLFVDDPNGAESEEMYKPIPFFMSSRGYGMFVHTSAPATFDFGRTFSGTSALMLGDDQLDLFVFLGEPKEILDEYTDLTGKTAMPPLWSFGFWMSRITYFSEEQVRDVAAKLREHRIPSDVIHLDTGWFETDWRCDYEFSKTRFQDPAKMIADLKDDGFHISLWQLPYFVPQNRLFPEIVEKGLAVRDPRGNVPYEDAVLDFTNPADRRVVPGEDRRPPAARGRGHQGGLRRGGADERPVRLGPDRLVRAQPLPAPLQPDGGGGHPGGHGRGHHLGPEHLGGQPALPAPLGRRRRQLRHRHGRDAARRPVAGPQRLLVLEPRHRRLHHPDPGGALPPVAALRDAHLPHPQPRGAARRSPGSTGPTSPTPSAGRRTCGTA